MKKDEKKIVLILGAGLMQKPSIEAAKELGFETIVLDANPKAVCASCADRFVQIDLKDKEKISRFAKSLGTSLKAVFTAGTDFSTSVSFAAQACSLPSHKYQAALNASNKFLMRKCFQKAGVPSPNFEQLTRNEITPFVIKSSGEKINYPKVVKPVDNMGARGCRMIRSFPEMIPSIEEAIHSSRSASIILEDYMQGPEYSIDALIYKGTMTITGFADRHIYFPPYFIETGHTMPAKLSDKKKNELILTFAKACKALGLTHGAAKADIKYTKKGPMIGEVAARLSGGYMSGWTFPYSSDLNLTKEALLIALNKKPEALIKNRVQLNIENAPYKLYQVESKKTSAERAWISIPGKVKKIYGLENACNTEFVKNLFQRTYEGNCVDFPRNNVEKCGNIISLSENYDLACSSAEKAASKIVMRLEAKNKATKKFLEGSEERFEDGFPPSAYQADEKLSKKLFDFCKKNPFVKAGKSLQSQLPSFLKEESFCHKDFNYRSIEQSAKLFDEIAVIKNDIDSSAFYKAFFRGGLQGILYICDSNIESGKKK